MATVRKNNFIVFSKIRCAAGGASIKDKNNRASRKIRLHLLDTHTHFVYTAARVVHSAHVRLLCLNEAAVVYAAVLHSVYSSSTAGTCIF